MQDPQLKKIQQCCEENRRWQRSADEKFDRIFEGQDHIIRTLERIEQECFLMNHHASHVMKRTSKNWTTE